MFTKEQLRQWRREKLNKELAFLMCIPAAFQSEFSDARIAEIELELTAPEMTQEQWDKEADQLYRVHNQ